MSGTGNVVTLGDGNDNATVSSGGNNTITFGQGTDTVEGGTGDTVQLTGNGNLRISGTNQMLFLGGGNVNITNNGQG